MSAATVLAVRIGGSAARTVFAALFLGFAATTGSSQTAAPTEGTNVPETANSFAPQVGEAVVPPIQRVRPAPPKLDPRLSGRPLKRGVAQTAPGRVRSPAAAKAAAKAAANAAKPASQGATAVARKAGQAIVGGNARSTSTVASAKKQP